MTLLGFGGMNINDLFGSYTAKRVRDLQTYYGLEVTGKGDKPTLDKINSILSSPYRQGERHKDVITLKENLTALGYGNMNINDLYGSFTETRVKQFQRDYSLVENGIADPVTLAKIESLATGPLEQGVRRKDVITLKENMTLLGFGGMNINDLFGSYTAKRVRDLQTYYGLEVTGKGDKPTLDKINSILSSPYRQGERHKDVITLKENLTALGYGNMNINDLYGSFTETRVKQFQRDYSLVENGIADPVTLAKIESLATGPLEQGVRRKDVITLKENMTLLGFGGMNINDLFGSYTAKRVRDLQTYYGLEVTGKGDKPTLDKINSILSSPYRQGERHKDVITLKENLTALGYGNMNINDLYGSFTETRVQQFQRDHGLVVNGIVDPVTEAKINSYFPDVLKEGVRSPQVIELKRKLITLGFGGMNVNDLYGSFTAKRVRQLKEYYGIDTSDDIVDSKVFEQIDEIISCSIKEGDRYSDVIELKEALVFLGYCGMNINDLYGSFTVTRVKQFQKDNGLTVNGLIDPVTRDLLESNRGIYYEGNRHPSIIEFKEKLTHLGFGNMNINNYYGSFTTTRVKQFQKYYGLKETGTGTPETLQKLDELYNTHLQEGKRHSSVISFKQKLIKLGFGNMNVNETYGSFTAKRVRQFQEHYGLRVNGIGDDRTLAKIDEILSTNFQEGRKHKDVIQLKKDLTSLGYGGMNINETYGSFTAKKVKEFQKKQNLTQSGIADEKTLEKIEEILYAINYSHYDYTIEEAFYIQMKQIAQTDKDEYA